MKRRAIRASRPFAVIGVVFFLITFAMGQSTSTIYGTALDKSGAVVPNAQVVATNVATGLSYNTKTDSSGNYQITGLRVGTYRLEITAGGMQKQVVNGLRVDVSKNVQQNFNLDVAGQATELTVTAANPVLESSTMTVGQVIDQKTVQEIPLNGRHFVDLGLLAAGSVTPPQSGFLTAPLRGQGSFAFNTAGNREDTVNFMINGINLNDMVQNQITFQPSINTVSEFKVDNQTYSAEYGRNSGAIVNIATRSGTNDFHGEVFEFLRNDFFDARNRFQKGAAPFKRNNFGAAVGGPIIKNKTFFFASYEGTRQRQGVVQTSNVLTDDQRAAVTDPIAQKLLALIPHGQNGGSTFSGAGTAPVDIDQWTGDVYHQAGKDDSLHFYYAFQRDQRNEPAWPVVADTVPGFGDQRKSHRQIGTFVETHTFSSNVVNEGRIGFNRIHITFAPAFATDPQTAAGFTTGSSVGIPQFTITQLGLTFGGPAGEPQGRGDTTYIASDTLSWLKGNHSIHIGGEVRRFNNNNFNGDTGTGTFQTLANFQAGQLSNWTITPGTRPSRIFTTSIGAFIQDSWKATRRLTIELGLRYDWNGTPTEADGRFINFDPISGQFVNVGDGPYVQSAKNFEPRLGFALDMFGDQKTVLRGGYGYAVDQPVTNSVTGLASNPPLAAPVSYVGDATHTIYLGSVTTLNPNVGKLSPNAIDPNFRNAYVQSYNLNIQHQFTDTFGMMIGYFGSKGTHLRLARNINQLVNGLAPYQQIINPISNTSVPVGTVSQVASAGNSNYNALWVTATKRISRGLQFDANYQWSKSLDYNSLSSQGIVIENSYDPRMDYGPSDFDARHRFVIDALYQLPFEGNRLVKGWQVSTITQIQSGNPFNIITTAYPQLTGSPNLRPDVTGPIQTTGNPTQWFANKAVFVAPTTGGLHFGNLGRNAVYGPGFVNTDFSLTKVTKLTERVSNEFRFEAFDLFNHPNLGQPGRILGSSSFGVIQSTRFPTGDSGSSRQLQFAMKLIF